MNTEQFIRSLDTNISIMQDTSKLYKAVDLYYSYHNGLALSSELYTILFKWLCAYYANSCADFENYPKYDRYVVLLSNRHPKPNMVLGSTHPLTLVSSAPALPKTNAISSAPALHKPNAISSAPALSKPSAVSSVPAANNQSGPKLVFGNFPPGYSSSKPSAPVALSAPVASSAPALPVSSAPRAPAVVHAPIVTKSKNLAEFVRSVPLLVARFYSMIILVILGTIEKLSQPPVRYVHDNQLFRQPMSEFDQSLESKHDHSEDEADEYEEEEAKADEVDEDEADEADEYDEEEETKADEVDEDDMEALVAAFDEAHAADEDEDGDDNQDHQDRYVPIMGNPVNLD